MTHVYWAKQAPTVVAGRLVVTPMQGQGGDFDSDGKATDNFSEP